MTVLLDGLWVCSAWVLGLYGLATLHLLLVRAQAPRPAPRHRGPPPFVTVQLPMYNERTVAERIINAAAALDWPRDRFEIQVLDDSTDETVGIAAQAVAHHQAVGLRISHVRRDQRTGFKAGALAFGLTRAKGSVIAIFDADFLPLPDTLVRLVPQLGEGVGLVQARWRWLNRDANLLTRCQSVHLDVHFGVEQVSRGSEALFMGFNGTAGVWRREAIDDAGGWRADTLTEDLDLSYRAQLAGYRLVYDGTTAAPCELVEEMAAVRTQQHRWMKGGAQVARMVLPTLLRARMPAITKLQAIAHLMATTVCVALLVLAVVGPNRFLLDLGSIPLADTALKISLVAVTVAAVFARIQAGNRRDVLQIIWELPAFLVFSLGMSLHNARAVMDGWRGQVSAFERTPKRGTGTGAHYRAAAAGVRWDEWALALLSAVAMVHAVNDGLPTPAVFFGLQTAGFAGVALFDHLREAPLTRRGSRRPAHSTSGAHLAPPPHSAPQMTTTPSPPTRPVSS